MKTLTVVATLGLALLIPSACDDRPTFPVPNPTMSPEIVKPGVFCSPEGAQGRTTGGTTMECKHGDDGRNRWREFEPGIEVR